MNINSHQYNQARQSNRTFIAIGIPTQMEKITLIMLTPRGRRFIDVGSVQSFKQLGAERCLVTVDSLMPVEGFY